MRLQITDNTGNTGVAAGTFSAPGTIPSPIIPSEQLHRRQQVGTALLPASPSSGNLTHWNKWQGDTCARPLSTTSACWLRFTPLLEPPPPLTIWTWQVRGSVKQNQTLVRALQSRVHPQSTAFTPLNLFVTPESIELAQSSCSDQLVAKRLRVQDPHSLGNHFGLQGDCRGRRVKGGVTSNYCCVTQTDGNHSETDW